MEYEEMVDRVVRSLGVILKEEDRDLIIRNLNTVNGIVKILNDNEESYELHSTQVIGFIIHNTLMEMYVSGRASFPETSE